MVAPPSAGFGGIGSAPVFEREVGSVYGPLHIRRFHPDADPASARWRR